MKLSEVKCTPMRFLPGDRLLVKTNRNVSSSDRHKILRMMQKWAGEHVEVLVIGPDLEMQVERSQGVRVGEH